jgi:sporulation-control protein spo0M
MGFFDKFKQMVGISGVKVHLVLPQNRYRQGETITGVVKVTGGLEAKMANKLSVSLVEIYPEITLRTTTVSNPVPPAPPGGSQAQSATITEIQTEALTSRSGPCQEIILAQQFQIPAQANLEYPISLTLPMQAAVSGPCQEWHLKAGLDIAGAFDAADTVHIAVAVTDPMQPAREFICNGAGFPTTCLLRIEAVSAAGERLSNRVYYL